MKKDFFACLSLSALLLCACGQTPVQSSSSSKASSSSTESSQQTSTSSETSVPSSSSKEESSEQPSSSSTSIPSSSSESTPEPIIDTVSILNKTALALDWATDGGDRKLSISATAEDLINVDLAVESGLIEIETSDSDIVSTHGIYLKARGVGTATITVKLREAIDTIEIVVSAPKTSAPRFYFDWNGEDTFEGYKKTSIILPRFSCFNAKNEDISSKVTVSSDLDEDATYNPVTGAFVSDVEGHHTVTFTAKDGEFSSSKSVNVEVYKNIFAPNRGGSLHVQCKGKGDSAFAFVDLNGCEVKAFDMQPSKLYYAEATYTKASKEKLGSGMVHSLPNTNDGFTRELLYRDGSDVNNIKSHNFAGSNGYFSQWRYSGRQRQFMTNDGGYDDSFDYNSFANDETTRIGIGRNGDTYIFTINGKIVDKYVSDYYHDLDTLPGFVADGWVTGENGTRAYNFQFFEEDKATDKWAELDSTFKPFGYLRQDSGYTQRAHIDNGNLAMDITNPNDYWRVMAVSNTYMRGDSRIKFRYTARDYNAGSDDYSLFNLQFVKSDNAGDPNTKSMKFAQWCFIHNNSFNVTAKFAKGNTESPWSYPTIFSGNGSTYHWDVKTYDFDITVKMDKRDVSVSYTITEVRDDARSFSDSVTSDVHTYGTASSQDFEYPWYCLTFQGHNKVSYTISDLQIASFIEE